MPESDFETRRFLVPEAVAEELSTAGYVRTSSGLTKGASAGEIALVVFNTGATTITLIQAPGVIRALARSLSKWFHSDAEAPYQMSARGPLGSVDFESTEPPDAEAVRNFLEKNVWGTADNPPEGNGE